MSVMNSVSKAGLAPARDLRATLQGRVVVRGDDAYADTRKIWNGAVITARFTFMD